MALIQVGITALRGPDGNFLPAVPLYEDIPDDAVQASGLTKTEEKSLDGIADTLYNKFKTYIDSCKEIDADVEEYLR